MKRFNFPSDQNAINVLYKGDVTLANSFSDRIVQVYFGIADCCKMRGGGSRRYNLFGLFLAVALLSCGCTSKRWKIRLKI